MTPQKLVILIDGIRHEFNAETFELSFNKYEGADIMLIVGTVEGNQDAQVETSVSGSPAEPEPGKVAIGVAKPSSTGITEETLEPIPYEGADSLVSARANRNIVFIPSPVGEQKGQVELHKIRTKYYDYSDEGSVTLATVELTSAEALFIGRNKAYLVKPSVIVFNKKDQFRIEEQIAVIKEEVQ